MFRWYVLIPSFMQSLFTFSLFGAFILISLNWLVLYLGHALKSHSIYPDGSAAVGVPVSLTLLQWVSSSNASVLLPLWCKNVFTPICHPSSPLQPHFPLWILFRSYFSWRVVYRTAWNQLLVSWKHFSSHDIFTPHSLVSFAGFTVRGAQRAKWWHQTMTFVQAVPVTYWMINTTALSLWVLKAVVWSNSTSLWWKGSALCGLAATSCERSGLFSVSFLRWTMKLPQNTETPLKHACSAFYILATVLIIVSMKQSPKIKICFTKGFSVTSCHFLCSFFLSCSAMCGFG